MEEVTRFDQDMDGSMCPTEEGHWVYFDELHVVQAENAALREQVAQLEFRNERLVADCPELQGLNENHAFNAKYFKAENEALKQQVEQGKRDAVPELGD